MINQVFLKKCEYSNSKIGMRRKNWEFDLKKNFSQISFASSQICQENT
jgi:hypothetical protein